MTKYVQVLYILLYLNTIIEDNFRVGAGSSALKALGRLPGSGKGCQGFKLCSILKVSEGCISLCTLAAIDMEETGDSALQALEKLPGSGKGYHGCKLCNILYVSERCFRLCSLAAVNKVGTGSSALQVLKKLPGSGKGYQDSKLCSILLKAYGSDRLQTQ